MLLKKMNKWGGEVTDIKTEQVTDIKTYYKVKVIMTVWYWHRVRQIDKWDKISRPWIHGNLIYITGGIEVHCEEGWSFK